MDFLDNAREHNQVIETFFNHYDEQLHAFIDEIVACFSAGNKILFCGNGGSACDSMHIAGEFVGRYKAERRGLPAIALSADNGIITAIGNDYGYNRVFARQVEALAKEGDMLIGLSTSGSSPNVIEALQAAQTLGVHCIMFTGAKGRTLMHPLAHHFVVESTNTAHIQECSMVALHGIAEGVESAIMSA